jgi:hypothetical protein
MLHIIIFLLFTSDSSYLLTTTSLAAGQWDRRDVKKGEVRQPTILPMSTSFTDSLAHHSSPIAS